MDTSQTPVPYSFFAAVLSGICEAICAAIIVWVSVGGCLYAELRIGTLSETDPFPSPLSEGLVILLGLFLFMRVGYRVAATTPWGKLFAVGLVGVCPVVVNILMSSIVGAHFPIGTKILGFDALGPSERSFLFFLVVFCGGLLHEFGGLEQRESAYRKWVRRKLSIIQDGE